MSRAAEIVALQLDLVDQFYLPHPGKPPLMYASMHARGEDRVIVPRSRMSEMADACARGGHQRGDSTAPMIVYGLKHGHTYRVQENMSALVVERADALPNGATPIGDITPPHQNGFAYFEEPVLGFDRGGLGYSAISWTCTVDAQPDIERVRAGDVEHVGLSFLIVVWAALARPEWRGHAPATGRGPSLTPITIRTAYAGAPVGRPWLPKLAEHADLDVPRARNPQRLAMALWQLLDEVRPAADGARVEQTGDEHMPRSLTKRARNLGAADPDVTTVILRREARPTINPGSGQPMTSRTWIEERKAWRWIGSQRDGTRQKVRRTVRAHWSNLDESLPVHERGRVVSELRR